MRDFSIDAVDKFLYCIGLKWDRAPAEPGKLYVAEEYGLVPFDRIRGRNHMVPADTEDNLWTKFVIRK